MIVSMLYSASGALHYVDAGSAAPTPPFTNWATAAIAIQDAVDVAVVGDQILVTNGTYATGGRAVGTNILANRVAVDKPLLVRSVNGPQFTVIQGRQVPGTTNGSAAIRCVYLASGAVLSGFTLTSGATLRVNSEDAVAGGAFCQSTNAVLTNCVVTGNTADHWPGGVQSGTWNNCVLSGNVGGAAAFSTMNGCVIAGNSGGAGGVIDCILITCTLATNSSVAGGGAAQSVLDNCFLLGNSASSFGGGAYSSKLNRCTLIANSSRGEGGGAWGSSLNDCLLIGNSAMTGGGTAESSLTNCTVVGNRAQETGGVWLDNIVNSIVYYNTATNGPDNANAGFVSHCCTTPMAPGTGNITNEPLLVSLTGAGFHLQTNSPCINAGNNACVITSTDLDGNPRIVGGTVDIGAYEFQAPASTISHAWLQQYSLPIDTLTDSADPDSDGMNNRQEWIAGTNPTNAESVLKIIPPSTKAAQSVLRWESVTNRSYLIERSTNLAAQPPFVKWATNIAGQFGTTTYPITSPAGLGTAFYRVGVQ